MLEGQKQLTAIFLLSGCDDSELDNLRFRRTPTTSPLVASWEEMVSMLIVSRSEGYEISVLWNRPSDLDMRQSCAIS